MNWDFLRRMFTPETFDVVEGHFTESRILLDNEPPANSTVSDDTLEELALAVRWLAPRQNFTFRDDVDRRKEPKLRLRSSWRRL